MNIRRTGLGLQYFALPFTPIIHHMTLLVLLVNTGPWTKPDNAPLLLLLIVVTDNRGTSNMALATHAFRDAKSSFDLTSFM